MVRIYWCLNWAQLYGRYPWLGFGQFRFLVSAASLWQAGDNRRLRFPKNELPRRELILDSGAFSLLTVYPDYPFSEEEYFDTAIRLEPDYVTARDVPCEPFGRLDLPISERIERTVEADRRILERFPPGSKPKPLPVIQGWEPEEYVRCIDLLRERGLLANRMAVGSCCKRASLGEILEVARTVRAALPGWVRLHFFGLKTAALCAEGFDRIADSVDTGAWTFGAGATYEPFEDGVCTACGAPLQYDDNGLGHLHRAKRPADQLDAFYRYRWGLATKVSLARTGEEEAARQPRVGDVW